MRRLTAPASPGVRRTFAPAKPARMNTTPAIKMASPRSLRTNMDRHLVNRVVAIATGVDSALERLHVTAIVGGARHQCQVRRCLGLDLGRPHTPCRSLMLTQETRRPPGFS